MEKKLFINLAPIFVACENALEKHSLIWQWLLALKKLLFQIMN